MRTALAIALAAGSLLVGVSLGAAIRPGSRDDPRRAPAVDHDPERAAPGSDDPRGATRARGLRGLVEARGRGRVDDSEPDASRPGERERPPSSNSKAAASRGDEHAEATAADDAAAPEARDRALREELSALREERRELLGEPIATPPSVDARFGGGVIAGAVQSAVAQAGVAGAVEATDCSEHPCIVFGRLEGDEEDMEEIERAAALSEYQSDVLTLLFWATTAAPGQALRTPETGLFAIAFYSFEDQAEHGEALDRRLRARVMEYWNADRPGAPE